MATRLKLLIPAPVLTLILKAFIFTGLLLIAVVSGGGAVLYAIYAVGAISAFIAPWINARRYLASFLVLVVLAPVVLTAVPGVLAKFAFGIAAGVFFGIILCLKDFFFVRRGEWNHMLFLVFVFILSALYFSADQSENFLLKNLGIFITVALLSREFLNIHSLSPIIAVLIGLVLAEVVWAVSILPAEPVFGAALAALAGFGFTEPIKRHLEGSLSNRSALATLTIFIALLVIILAAVRWTI